MCPYLGYLADKNKGFSRKILFSSTIIVILLSFSLWFAKANINLFLFLSIIVLANVCFEIGQAFYNSQLINFKVGKIGYGKFSGKAWASGYLGGIICLILILVLILIPDKSLFKLNANEYENIESVGLS